MSCRCNHCSSSAPPPSFASEGQAWPPPVVPPGQLPETGAADLYDKVFEISMNHYALFLPGDPGRLLGAAVLFADVYVATVAKLETSGSQIQTDKVTVRVEVKNLGPDRGRDR